MSERRLPVLYDGRTISCALDPVRAPEDGEVRHRRDEYDYLGHEKQCMFCLRKTPNWPNPRLTKEHLVPRIMKRKFKNTIGLIYPDPRNHIIICPDTHRDIDGGQTGRRNGGFGGKTYMFQEHGMYGLVTHLGSYPRANDPTYFDWQEFQFRALFEVLEVQMAAEIHSTKDTVTELTHQILGTRWHLLPENIHDELDAAKERRDDLLNAADRAHKFSEEWKKGNFGNQFLDVS